MFSVGDTILYSSRGVCKIDEIIYHNDTPFYKLVPVFSQAYSISIPINTESEAKMRKILSRKEIDDMIASLSLQPLMWIDDDKKRAFHFKEILSSGNRLEIMRLIRLLYERQLLLKAKNKRLHLTDERIFKEAEEILYNEFAYVLNIKREQVIDFIANKITVSSR